MNKKSKKPPFSRTRGRSREGFSLIELAVVIGVMIILSIFIFSSLLSRRSRLNLDNTARQITASLREAQSRSIAQEGATIWGVHFDNGTTTPFYALFKTSYSASTIQSLQRLPTSVCFATSSIAQGGTLDITFAQISGLPSTSTSITLNLVSGSCAGAAAGTQSSVSRTTSGKIFFDDFNRSNL